MNKPKQNPGRLERCIYRVLWLTFIAPIAVLTVILCCLALVLFCLWQFIRWISGAQLTAVDTIPEMEAWLDGACWLLNRWSALRCAHKPTPTRRWTP